MKEATKEDDARLNIQLDRAELYNLKQAALTARITLRKYVRLKLGLDSPEPKRKAS